jgi:hypothetical protein
VSFEGVPERPAPPPRLGRAALLAFGAMVAAGAPGCTSNPAPVDAYYGGAVDAYGAPDVGPRDTGIDAWGAFDAAYGGPDAGPLDDAGGAGDAAPAADGGADGG